MQANSLKIRAKSLKIWVKSLKIWAKFLKIRAKMAPNVCRKTHEDLFFLEVITKMVFMIFEEENLQVKSSKKLFGQLWKVGQKSFEP